MEYLKLYSNFINCFLIASDINCFRSRCLTFSPVFLSFFLILMQRKTYIQTSTLFAHYLHILRTCVYYFLELFMASFLIIIDAPYHSLLRFCVGVTLLLTLTSNTRDTYAQVFIQVQD